VNGRTFVTEDDIRGLTIPVLDHRLIYRNREAKQKALTLIMGRELDRLSKLNITVNRTAFVQPSTNI
jgi:MoxR-like ATPase